MTLRDWDARARYKVVVNSEQMYSIWPVDRENPIGWKDAGRTGAKQECLDYIEEVWTDIRSVTLQDKMEEAAQKILLDDRR